MSKVENLELQRAIRARDEFLEKHPQLKKFQKELEEMFAVNGNDPVANLQIISGLANHLRHKQDGLVKELEKELNKVEQIVETVKKEVEKAVDEAKGEIKH